MRNRAGQQVIDGDMPRSYAWDTCVVGAKVGALLPKVGKAEHDAWPHASPASAAVGAKVT